MIDAIANQKACVVRNTVARWLIAFVDHGFVLSLELGNDASYLVVRRVRWSKDDGATRKPLVVDRIHIESFYIVCRVEGRRERAFLDKWQWSAVHDVAAVRPHLEGKADKENILAKDDSRCACF